MSWAAGWARFEEEVARPPPERGGYRALEGHAVEAAKRAFGGPSDGRRANGGGDAVTADLERALRFIRMSLSAGGDEAAKNRARRAIRSDLMRKACLRGMGGRAAPRGGSRDWMISLHDSVRRELVRRRRTTRRLARRAHREKVDKEFTEKVGAFIQRMMGATPTTATPSRRICVLQVHHQWSSRHHQLPDLPPVSSALKPTPTPSPPRRPLMFGTESA